MSSAPNPAPLARYAWFLVALLWPVALLNYLDRQLLAAMKFSLMADVPTIGSEANWGLLPAVFKWVYAILSPVGGFLADRFGARFVIGGSLLVWSAVTWATGHVHTFDQLLVTRALMGISEACYIPAALPQLGCSQVLREVKRQHRQQAEQGQRQPQHPADQSRACPQGAVGTQQANELAQHAVSISFMTLHGS